MADSSYTEAHDNFIQVQERIAKEARARLQDARDDEERNAYESRAVKMMTKAGSPLDERLSTIAHIIEDLNEKQDTVMTRLVPVLRKNVLAAAFAQDTATARDAEESSELVATLDHFIIMLLMHQTRWRGLLDALDI